MLSLDDLAAQGVEYKVITTENSTYLIDYLKEDGKVTPKLKVFIAGILEGNVKAKPKSYTEKDYFISPTARFVAKVILDDYKTTLQHFNSNQSGTNCHDENVEGWKIFSERLKQVGYTGVPEEKGQIAKAAKLLLMDRWNLTASQLDELLYPRKQREKITKKFT